jgi:hypothetical protein
MARWRTPVETWLEAEQDGREDAAEAAFDHVFAALPAVEPSPAFVARASEAAWAAAGHRRRMAGLAATAAAVLVVGASAAVLYVAFDGRTAWLLAAAASLASGAVLSLVTAGATVASWWSIGADAGLALATAIANPYSVVALAAIELVAIAALVMLHRLLQSDVEIRAPRAYCY